MASAPPTLDQVNDNLGNGFKAYATQSISKKCVANPTNSIPSNYSSDSLLTTSTSLPAQDEDFETNIEKIHSVNTQVRSQLSRIRRENKVLVIGARRVGKTSLINSLWLAMTGESDEVSEPAQPKFHLGDNTLYERPARRFPSTVGRDGTRRADILTGGSIHMYDTRGIQDIHSDSKMSLIIRYILEGKISRMFFHQSLMLSEATLRSRKENDRVDHRNVFKSIIFVERSNPTPEMHHQTERLAKCLQTALSQSVHRSIQHIPIIRIQNGCEPEVMQDASRRMSTISLSQFRQNTEYGLPSSFHSLDSYRWYDDEELDGADSDGSTTRFLFPSRCAPTTMERPEQHLSLLLFLKNLLDILIDPQSELARSSRLDLSVRPKNTCLNIVKILFS